MIENTLIKQLKGLVIILMIKANHNFNLFSTYFSGTKEDVLISILGNRSNNQRVQIKEMFKTMFGKVLLKFFL
jgi:hypothetical protein